MTCISRPASDRFVPIPLVYPMLWACLHIDASWPSIWPCTEGLAVVVELGCQLSVSIESHGGADQWSSPAVPQRRRACCCQPVSRPYPGLDGSIVLPAPSTSLACSQPGRGGIGNGPMGNGLECCDLKLQLCLQEPHKLSLAHQPSTKLSPASRLSPLMAAWAPALRRHSARPAHRQAPTPALCPQRCLHAKHTTALPYGVPPRGDGRGPGSKAV